MNATLLAPTNETSAWSSQEGLFKQMASMQQVIQRLRRTMAAIAEGKRIAETPETQKIRVALQKKYTDLPGIVEQGCCTVFTKGRASRAFAKR